MTLVSWQLADAVGVNVADATDLGPGLAAIGLTPSRPVVVLVGGAGGLSPAELERLRPGFADGLVPLLGERRTVVVDGGTDSGVMRLLGQEQARAAATFALVGVVAKGTVRLPGTEAATDAAELEPHHTHFVVVPGEEWGAEAPWIARTATVLAGDAPSVTILVNGGEIAFTDVASSVDAGRPVLVVAGSGRTADQFDAALRRPAGRRAGARSCRVRLGDVGSAPSRSDARRGRSGARPAA